MLDNELQSKVLNDDEVYLFEVLGIIWKEKWIVLVFILIFLGAGGAYILSTKTVYEIKIPYVENTSYKSVNLVFIDILSSGGIVRAERKHMHKGKVVLLAKSQSDAQVISKQIKNANVQVTKEVLKKTKNEMDFLANELPEAIKGTDVVAKQYLEKKALIDWIETSEGQVLTVGDPIVTIKSPRISLILGVLFFLGFTVGLFYVFLKRRISSYHNRNCSV